ncbi:vitellogenin-1-like [Ornithodoros turicata]|uniref:vitellogenin-1-like n=1 Tax=Ornithodoros turicata TaxID=34597 RepID=UPI00313978D8
MIVVLLPLLLVGSVSGYDVGKEYLYTYDGTLEVTQADAPSVGLAFKSKVLVQPKDVHVHLKIVDFVFDTVRTDEFARHHFSYHSSPALERDLEKVFAVRFTDDKFENIEFDKSDSLLSRNIKRALASLLQVDLSHGRSDDIRASEYNVFEEGIHGVCETQYVVSNAVDGDDAQVFLDVTKVRNLQNCSHSPGAFYGSFRGQKCDSCESKDKHPLIMNSAVEYRVRGIADRFVIDKALSTASKTYNPFNEGKVVVIIENSALSLVEVREATTDTTMAADTDVHTSLGEEQPVSTTLRVAEDLKRPNNYVSTFIGDFSIEEFHRGFQELVNADFTEEDYQNALHRDSTAYKFMSAYFLALGLSYDATDEFYKNYVQHAPEEQKDKTKHLFLDLLSATGTNRHLVYGLHLIQEGQLTVEQARRFLNRIPFNLIEPSEAVLRAILNAYESEFVRADEHLEGTCLLAVGSLVESDCQRTQTDEKSDGGLCRPDIVQLFFNYSTSPNDVWEKSDYMWGVYLENGGKLATRQAIRKLARFASPRVRCPLRRQLALSALAQAGPKQPRLVRHVLLPIYVNTSESHPTRIAAFVGLVATNPDLHLLRYIARKIILDPSDQLASYVTSFFREMVKTKYPCYSALARKLKNVVPLWNHVSRFAKKPEYTRSRFVMTSTYNEKYNYGGTTEVSTVMSKDSYLPQSFHYVVKDFFAGFSHDALSITYQGWGVDRFFAGLVAQRPATRRSLWNFFGRRRIARGAEERQRVDASLPITPRDFKPFVGSVKLKIFDHTVETWPFDERLLDVLKEPSKLGENLAGRVINLLQREGKTTHFYLTPTLVWQFPTEMGFPAFLELKQTNFFHVNRQQTTFATEDDKLQLGLQRHFLYDTYAYMYFGFGLQSDRIYLGAGYEKKLSVSLPLKFEATYDLRTHKLSLKRPLPIPADLVKYSFKPFTSLDYYNANFTPIYNEEELSSHNKNYLTGSLGFGFDVKSLLFPKRLKESLHHFWHDLDFRQKIYYLDANPHWHPRFLSIRAVPAEKDPTHTVEVDVGYKSYKPEDVERHSNFLEHENAPVNTTSHVFNVDFRFKGDNKTRSIRTELQVTHTKDLLKHWVALYYDRSPFHEDEENHTKVCLRTAATFPATDWNRTDRIATFYQGFTINAEAELNYGTDCVHGSRISAHGTYEHTDAEAEEINDIVHETPANRFEPSLLRKLHDKCRIYQEQGIKLNYFCIKYMYHTSRLGKLNLDVEYHNFEPIHCPYLRAALHRGEERPGFFSTVLSHMQGAEGRLHVLSQVPAHTEPHGTASVLVSTADGHEFVHDHVPTYTRLLEPRVFKVLSYTNLQEYSTRYKHARCDLQGQSVRTFDGVVVPLPDTDCYKLVARDCSPHNSFIVMARTTNVISFPKALKMFIADAVIDIFPSDGTEGAVLQINGETVPLSLDHPYSHVSDGAELFYVEGQGRFFRINSNSRGVYAFFNARHGLFVEVAPFYRGKVCGLCGDYNYDRQNELRGPDKRLYNDTAEFARSYVVLSDDCRLL